MSNQRRRLILFARFPIAGKVKTRLIPALGAEGAAALHRRLVLRTLRTAHALCQSQNVELEIRFAGDSENEMRHWLGDGWLCRPQCNGDLGQRMAGAFADSFREGSPATIGRKDGHHPIIFMQCGPVRHRVDAKKQAAARPFTHQVFVRPTAFRPPHAPGGGSSTWSESSSRWSASPRQLRERTKMTPNEKYSIDRRGQRGRSVDAMMG